VGRRVGQTGVRHGIGLRQAGQIATREFAVRLRVRVDPQFGSGAGDRALDLRGRARDEDLGGDVRPTDHQRVRRDEGPCADHRAVEDRAVIGDQRLGPDVRTVNGAHVRDGGIRTHVDRYPRRGVQHRTVLNIGALADDHRSVVSPQHRVEPDRRAGLDGDVADEDGCRGDERGGIDLGRTALEGVERHRSHIPQARALLHDVTPKL